MAQIFKYARKFYHKQITYDLKSGIESLKLGEGGFPLPCYGRLYRAQLGRWRRGFEGLLPPKETLKSASRESENGT